MSDEIQNSEIEVLIVDDDAAIRGDLTDYFRQKKYRVTSCASGPEALAAAETHAFDVAVVDLLLPGMNGIELIKEIKKLSNECEAVILTGEGSIETAVEAMKAGVHDYVTKPVRLQELEAILRRAHASSRLKVENQRLKAALEQQVRPAPRMVGASRCMQDVFRLIERVAITDKPVLIQGESGSGKELVARALHEASPLAARPFVVINCAALPETLLESELFGHEKGAFTGAVASKPGLFEVADGGTLFVDEIGELAGSLQAKLLRVLEDGVLRRVGSIRERRVKVRLIAATNRNMEVEVRAGRFREDLYYRINVLTIHLPPLRDRKDDIPLLVDRLLGPNWVLDTEVMPTLLAYDWPGNVRQLQNALERAKILATDNRIQVENFPAEVQVLGCCEKSSVAAAVTSAPARNAVTDLETLTRSYIVETYQKFGGNKARTARALGVGRRSLYRMLERYGLHEPSTPTA